MECGVGWREAGLRDESGEMRLSAKLENKLHQDLLANVEVSHPSHVRMICYVMKLMEKKGKLYKVLFFEASDLDNLEKSLASHIKNHDINIGYTAASKVVALFDRSDEEIESFTDSVKTDCITARVLKL